MRKTILVTGGAGYIGSHTCVELIENGYNVVVLDNLSNSNAKVFERIADITGVQPLFIKGDVRDLQTVATLLYWNSVDAVIHFAGLKSPSESFSKPLEYYDVNVGGTLNLVRCMEDANINHMVFSSSANVYANRGDKDIYVEGDDIGPTNPYGLTKAVCENILTSAADASDEFRVSLLRYFNPIGAHSSGLIGENPLDIPNNIAPMITGAMNGVYKNVTVYGNDYDTEDGTGVRDYIHVVDLARAHVSALNYIFSEKGSTSEVFNIGTGQGTSVLELINTFQQVSQRELNVVMGGRRDGDIATCIANPQKANDVLKWKATHTLPMMCKSAWDWQVKSR